MAKKGLRYSSLNQKPKDFGQAKIEVDFVVVVCDRAYAKIQNV